MKAVAEGDYQGLRDLLTPAERDGVESHLRQAQAMLRDDAQREQIVAYVREHRGDVTDAEIARARDGSIEDAWNFFSSAEPRSATPKRMGLRVEPNGREVTVIYADHAGNPRRVLLVQSPRGWAVARIQF